MNAECEKHGHEWNGEAWNDFCNRCGDLRMHAEDIAPPEIRSGEWVGEGRATEIFIQGWETMPTEIKVAMINMAWAIKRALDAGWKPKFPSPTVNDMARISGYAQELRQCLFELRSCAESASNMGDQPRATNET